MSFGVTPKDGRRALDWYPTPEALTFALCARMDLPELLAEPCAGDLSMVSVLTECGYNVLSGDVDPRWSTDLDGPLDFLDPRALDVYAGRVIVTNPPFNKAPEVVRQALRIARKTAMLLPINWLEPCQNRGDVVSIGGHAMIFQRCKPHTHFKPGQGDSKTVMWRIFDLDAREITVSHVRKAELDAYVSQTEVGDT